MQKKKIPVAELIDRRESKSIPIPELEKIVKRLEVSQRDVYWESQFHGGYMLAVNKLKDILKREGYL